MESQENIIFRDIYKYRGGVAILTKVTKVTAVTGTTHQSYRS